jgi:prepilin-type N-terminal cleavage/methylation domain-containing protein
VIRVRVHPLQRGFSLLELAVGITLLSLLTVTAASAFAPWMKFRQTLSTDARLRDWQVAIESAYREEALRIDASSQAVLSLAGGVLADGARSGRDTVAGLVQYAPHGADVLYGDGFNQPYWVFVSPRLRKSFEGVDLYYHTVAIVSAGPNGQLDPGTTFDRSVGVLSLAGDDAGVVVDGYPIAREHHDDALARLRRLADAYQTYFRSRFLSDPRRDIAVDYFSASCGAGGDAERWDTAGPAIVANSCGADIAIGPGELQALGVEPRDALDPFGRAMRLDNASTRVRNPDNPEVAMGVPPYTARVLTSLPGDVTLAVAVTGSF